MKSMVLQFLVPNCLSDYFDGHPKICISFIFCRQSLDILEAALAFIFSSYERWQFIGTISLAHEKYSDPLFRYYTTMENVSKSKGFAALPIEKYAGLISIYIKQRSYVTFICLQ
jgi:hypothetical protein